jgi:phosphoribosylformylglycinamidine synthase
MFGYTGKNIPNVNIEEVIPLYKAVSEAIGQELLASVHGVYRGGLGVHLAQVAFGGDLGLEIDLKNVPAENIEKNDKLLFSESAGRFIITLAPENQSRFEEILNKYNCRFGLVGKVTEEKNLVVYSLLGSEEDKLKIIESEIADLRKAWKNTFGGLV